MRAAGSAMNVLARSSKAPVERRVFSLDNRLTWMSATRKLSHQKRLATQTILFLNVSVPFVFHERLTVELVDLVVD